MLLPIFMMGTSPPSSRRAFEGILVPSNHQTDLKNLASKNGSRDRSKSIVPWPDTIEHPTGRLKVGRDPRHFTMGETENTYPQSAGVWVVEDHVPAQAFLGRRTEGNMTMGMLHIYQDTSRDPYCTQV